MERILESMPGKFRWFDAVYVAGRSTPLSFRNNRFHSLSESESSGFGIRINRDGRTGFSYTNDPQRRAGAVERAYGMAPYGDPENFTLPSDTTLGFEPYDPAIEYFSVKDEIAAAEEFISSLRSEFPEISIDMGISASSGVMRLMNSEGVDISYRDSYYTVSVSCVLVMDNGVRIDTWEGKSDLRPVEYNEFKEKLIEKIKRAQVQEKVATGTYPVILPPQAFSRFAGIIASGLNGVAVWKGVSPFAGKIGEKLFSDKFTLADDPLVDGSPYRIPFDAEGVNVSRKELVSRGVVSRFITDLKYAERLSTEPSGNASRGFSSLPSPSFTGITVEPGDSSFMDMISGIERGIIAEQFIGLGQSNTLTGDFSASLDLAFLVENGEIKGRVKDCMMSGNIIDLLKGEVHFSSERERKGSAVMPYAMFPAVSVTA